MAANFYKPVVRLTHKHQVMGMYRRALRECFNYAENRDLFIMEATRVRARFDANMHLNPGEFVAYNIYRRDLLHCLASELMFIS